MANYVSFNQRGYLAALKRGATKVVDVTSQNVFSYATHNLGALKTRGIDAKYVNSFASVVKLGNIRTKGKIISNEVTVDPQSDKEGFRAIYYEYGTGSKMKPPKGYNPLADTFWNRLRPPKIGADFYYRDSFWYDLGGNLHPRGGVKNGVVRKIPENHAIAQPIEAQFWFRQAVEDAFRLFPVLVWENVITIPITNFIKIKDIRKKM